MQFSLTIINGKSVKGAKEIQNYLKKLNGTYNVDINEENTMSTPAECRAAYFFKIDLVVAATGDERYAIHERFKEETGIKSTRNFTVIDWRNFIKQFQIYIFDSLDIVI